MSQNGTKFRVLIRENSTHLVYFPRLWPDNITNGQYFVRRWFMSIWILRFFSLGRKLPDAAIVSFCSLPVILLSIPVKLDIWIYATATVFGLYFLGQIFIRLNYRSTKEQASRRRSEKSTQWAQSFIVEHLSEIRRPLQGLIGVREVYDFNFENKDTQEYMEIVNHCSEHVVRLINRLQLYSELKSDEYYDRDIRFTLSNILEDSLRVAESNNPGKKVDVSQHISPKVLRDYFGPYELVRSLIVEVIDNAIRYSPRADLEISADTSEQDDHNLVITISDRGPGMRESVVAELQSKLDRHASSYDLRVDGEGMGIPLIRNLARKLSAVIEIKTEKGNGTNFRIHLKLPAYVNHVSDSQAQKTQNISDQILVVEDDPLAQKIVAAMLNRLGYRSTVVSNGHDAVELCRRQRFGFILMDLEMPIMDGWEAARHILNIYKKDEKPVIVALTARNSLTDRARAKKAGCKAFLQKPVNREQLDKLLKTANIEPHFEANANYSEESFDGLEHSAERTIDLAKMFAHYDRDMSLCQIILLQAMSTLPNLLDQLDSSLLEHNSEDVSKILHQMTGEFKALLCNTGVQLVARINNHGNPDSIEFISDLEHLNRYCDSLLKEISILAKHNEVLAN